VVFWVADTFTSRLGLDITERQVIANSIANNAGQLFFIKSGLLVNENRVKEYEADKKSIITMKIRRWHGRMALSEKEDISESRIATGAARIDNL